MASQDLTALEWAGAHHYYLGDETKQSIDKMREEANFRAQDKRSPGDSVIHHHPYRGPSGYCILEGTHEQYRAGEGRIGDSGR